MCKSSGAECVCVRIHCGGAEKCATPHRLLQGGGASSELLILHRDSRRRVSVRSGPRCLRMLSFHKRKWRLEGADIYEELAKTEVELMGGWDSGVSAGAAAEDSA